MSVQWQTHTERYTSTHKHMKEPHLLVDPGLVQHRVLEVYGLRVTGEFGVVAHSTKEQLHHSR